MKLLIADDEVQIRSGLTEGVDWREAGFAEVYGAANGTEAWELFKKHSPDVVITDIRMPGMDGIELSRRMKERQPSVRIMILSGYSDFEYAKQALRIGVTDYELKPLKLRSLLELVENARQSLIEERTKEARNLIWQGTHWLKRLKRGELQGERLLAELAVYFADPSSGSYRCIAVELDRIQGRPEDGEAAVDKFDYVRRGLAKFGETSEQLLAEDGLTRCLLLVKTGFHRGANEWEQEWFGKLAELNGDFGRDCGGTLTVGLSTSGGWEEAGRLVQEACVATEHKLVAGRGSRTLYRQEKGRKPLPVFHENLELKEAIVSADAEAATRILSAVVGQLRETPGLRSEEVRQFIRDGLGLLARTVSQMGISFEERFGSHADSGLLDDRLETLEDYGDWLSARYGEVIRGLAANNGVRQSVPVRKAIEAIRGDIARDWTVEKLAELAGLTPNYFSHLFKKETGTAFREFLNDARIAEAKRLLKTTAMLAYEVTDKVGFGNYKHFCQVFKKSEGCSPTEFRKSGTAES